MTTHTQSHRHAAGSKGSGSKGSGFKSPGALIAILLDRLAIWAERRRQRRDLGGLSDSLLRDIGLARADVDDETGKPFWRY